MGIQPQYIPISPCIQSYNLQLRDTNIVAPLAQDP